MKKFFIINISIFLISVISISSAAEVYANSTQFLSDSDIVDLILCDVNCKSETIQRIDCLVAIMNAMGYTNYDAFEQDTDCFPDYRYWADSFETTIWDRDLWNNGYLQQARLSCLIYGEPSDGGFRFGYFDPVTVGTCIGFMTRAIVENDNLTDISEITKKAREIGLLKPNDKFYYNIDYVLKPEDFKELLTRFLNQRPNKYWLSAENKMVESAKEDKIYASYLEFLNNYNYSWLNKSPEKEYRYVLINVDGLPFTVFNEVINVKPFVSRGEVKFPLITILYGLEEFSGRRYYTHNYDGSYNIDNGYGNIISIMPDSEILTKDGVDIQLPNKIETNNCLVTKEILDIIFSNRLSVDYYMTKSYFVINVSLLE